jgi:hypothetical protein
VGGYCIHSIVVCVVPGRNKDCGIFGVALLFLSLSWKNTEHADIFSFMPLCVLFRSPLRDSQYHGGEQILEEKKKSEDSGFFFKTGCLESNICP